MKRLLFTFLLSLGFILFIGIGRAYAADCPDGYIKGENPIDEMTISCATSSKQESTITLTSGDTYILEASGQCNWRTPGSAGGYLADAEYWLRHDQYGEGWMKQNPGSIALWNGTIPVNYDWGDYNGAHLYSTQYIPSEDGKLKLYFYDDIYSDNSGNLEVDIYQCNTLPEPTGEILTPYDDEVISGTYAMTANYNDYNPDNDIPYWAIRSGNCSGLDVASWSIDDYLVWETPNVFFSYDFDSTEVPDGKYCFVWNPNSNADNVRDTVLFYVDNDKDNDGVPDIKDFCDNTIAFTPDADNDKKITGFANPYFVEWGQNRWLYTPEGWSQKFTKKGITDYNIGGGLETTLGCTCADMLTELNKLGDFIGHWKYGCSSSILEHFVQDAEDGVIDGYNMENPYDLNEVKSDGTITTSETLMLGQKYLLKAYGTFEYNTAGDWADPEWYLKSGEIVKGDTEGSEPYVLDVSINGYTTNIDWGVKDEVNHTYYHTYIGEGSPITFSIYDSNHSDNDGSLFVDIYKYLY